MSAENNNGAGKHEVKIPTEYWMIACEWTEIIQEPSVATADNPTASGKKFARRRMENGVSSVHPIIYASQMMQGRQDFVVTWAVPISKFYYDLVMSPTPTQQQVSDIADKVEKEEKEKPDLKLAN